MTREIGTDSMRGGRMNRPRIDGRDDMKHIRKPDLKYAQTCYFYADGHWVIACEKTDKNAGRVEWVEVYETLGVEPRFA